MKRADRLHYDHYSSAEPTDEYCVAAEVLVDLTVASDGWRISGEVVEALR